MFKRLVATSRAPQIMVLSILRSFGKIGPQIDQIWAWLSRGHRWSAGVRNPLKSSVTGPSLLVNCYLEIKFHKIIRVTPPPPPPPLTIIYVCTYIWLSVPLICLIKQARIIIHTVPNLWETPEIEPVTTGLTSVYQTSSSTT